MEYVVLVAELENGTIKSALVAADEFENDGGDALDYFVGAKSADKSGTVEITGDEHLLDSIYTSD